MGLAPGFPGAGVCLNKGIIITNLEAYSSRRIIKNTFFLYFRMLIILGISLYTQRLILEALGIEDYGLYNVVGGIVALFTIVNSALSAGSSRFLTFELGRGDLILLKKTFSASFVIHSLIAIFVFLLAETIGLWYVNTWLVVPDRRLIAANWVYQFSIVSCMLSLTQVPYSAIIIAHERMNIYAGLSVAEAVYKLLLVYILLYTSIMDTLILYGLFLCVGTILTQVFYRFYCVHHFKECKLVLIKEKSIYKKMISFSLWDVMGGFAVTGNSTGINILINYFFGVTVNAARGIASQVENALTMFSNNFMTAVKPQIVKLYAEGRNDKMLSLVFESSKYSFFLLYVVSLPVFLEAEYILGIWLKEVPEFTVLFLRCIILSRLIRAFANPVVQAVHATGNIKWLNIYAGGASIVLQIPLTYMLFRLGYPAVSTYIVGGIASIVCNYLELLTMKKEIPFSIWHYFCKVYMIGILITVVSLVLPLCIYYFLQTSFLRLLLSCLASIISVGIFVFYIGISSDNRRKLILLAKNKINGR